MAQPAPGFEEHPDHTVDLTEPDQRVTVRLGDIDVATSARAVRLDEAHYPARYYIPQLDIKMDLLIETDHSTYCPFKGHARYWSLKTGDQHIKNCAWSYDDPYQECLGIQGLVSFYADEFEIKAG